MKKLFAYDMSNKNTDTDHSSVFLKKEFEDEKYFEQLDEIGSRFTGSQVSGTSYLKFTVIALACLGAMIFSFILLGRTLDDPDSSPLPLIVPLFFGLCGMIALVYGKKLRSSEPIIDRDSLLEKEKEIKKYVCSANSIPDTAITADILNYFYKTDKDGNEKKAEYSVTRVFLYEEDGSICFADEYSVFAFPRSAFKSIAYRDERISILSLASPSIAALPPNNEYIISETPYNVTVHGYYSIFLEHGGEDYEIRIPNYEIKSYSEMLDLRPSI